MAKEQTQYKGIEMRNARPYSFPRRDAKEKSSPSSREQNAKDCRSPDHDRDSAGYNNPGAKLRKQLRIALIEND